jgi:hypothetical protein
MLGDTNAVVDKKLCMAGGLTGDFCTKWNERESTWYKIRRSRHPAPTATRLAAKSGIAFHREVAIT